MGYEENPITLPTDSPLPKFGLRHKPTGRLVGFKAVSNHNKDGVDPYYQLSTDDFGVWLVDKVLNAEYVRHYSTFWYNADYNTPAHGFSADDLEVITLNVSVSITPVQVRIPTPYEFFERKYAATQPKHWEYLQHEFDKEAHDPSIRQNYRHIKYSYNDLQMLVDETDWKIS